MIIIMLGAPASGKGSVAGILSKEFNIPSVSSGDIFRKYISEGTEIGKIANEYMTKGELVPDDVTIKLIVSRLEEDDVKDGMILDGFPRTVHQAEELDKTLSKLNKKIDLVVSLESNESELLNRIVNRRICPKCKSVYNTVLSPSKVEGICDVCGSKLEQRDDDTLEKAKNRINVYKAQTAPVANYYKKTGKLYPTLLSEKENRLKDVVSKEIIDHLKK